MYEIVSSSCGLIARRARTTSADPARRNETLPHALLMWHPSADTATCSRPGAPSKETMQLGEHEWLSREPARKRPTAIEVSPSSPMMDMVFAEATSRANLRSSDCTSSGSFLPCTVSLCNLILSIRWRALQLERGVRDEHCAWVWQPVNGGAALA